MKEKLSTKKSFEKLTKHESDERYYYLMWIRLHRLSVVFMTLLLILGCKNNEQHPTFESILHPSSKEKNTTALSGIRKKVMHLNLCGKNCWSPSDPDGGGVESRGSISRMTKVLAAVDFYNPHILTFNEICYSQYRAIRSDLISRGYGATYASTTMGGNCDNFDASWGQGFGNAIFFKGTSPESSTKFVLPNAEGAEPRHLLYTDVPLDGKVIRVATTHLTLDATWRKKQLEFIRDKGALWISQNRPVIITGDFNAIPTDVNMGLMYSHSGGTGQFQECDEGHSCPSPLTFCRWGEYTFNETKKLDYIFFSAIHFGGMQGDAKSRYPSPVVSDHNILQGSAVWQ